MKKSRSLFACLVLTFLILFLVGYALKTEKLPESREENKTKETTPAIAETAEEKVTIPEEKPKETTPATAETDEEKVTIPEEKPMTRGIVDSDLVIEVYDKNKAMDGTTLLPDNRNSDKPKIIEVNMLGEII